MMNVKILLATAVSILALPMICGIARAQGTAFTYQGQLTAGGVEANGSFDLQFGLYTNVSTGNPVGSLLTNAATAVSNGVFTTTLNFSNAFNGTAYWLGIGVRSNGTTNAFTPLIPRQPITPTPYAITASNLTGTLAASQLTGSIPASVFSGTFSNSVSFTNVTNVFAGNGGGLTNVPSVTQSNYLFAYDTTDQFVSTAGVYQNVTINTVTNNGGWTNLSSGIFAAPQSGLYLVEYQAHIQNGNAGNALTASLRAVLNATTSLLEIPGSESVVSIPADGFIALPSRSFLAQMSAGQTISLQVTANMVNPYAYLFSSTFGSQTFPSVALTIVRIQ